MKKKSSQPSWFYQSFALSAAAYLSMTGRVQAEEAIPVTPAPAPSSSTMNEVLVTGQQGGYKTEAVASPKYTVPLRNIPQTIQVVPQKAIQEQGATTLRDVLRNVPGISIQAGEGGVPNGDNLTIRGFNARTDIFVDGVRDTGGQTRDPFNVQQVEVTKGPSSAFMGRGSTGGAVNMVSKTPTQDAFYTGTFGLGTDKYKRSTVDLNRPVQVGSLEGSALRLGAMWTESGTAGRDAVESERWGFAPSVAFGLGTPTRVTLAYSHLTGDNLPDYGLPWVPTNNVPLAAYANQPPPVSFDNFYGLRTRDFEETDNDMGTAEIKHDLSDTTSLRYLLRYGVTRRDSVVAAPRFSSTANTNLTRELQSRDQKDAILANVADLTTKFKTGFIDHALVTGVEVDRETSVNYARTGPAAPLANLFNPNVNDTYTGRIVRSGARTETTAKSAGAYAFDTLALSDQWDLTGGLRWDSFDVDYVAVSTSNAVTSLSRTDDMISWRSGIVFKPVEKGSIYAAYGTSLNPSAEGLTLANTATALNNANTAPEKNRSMEVGTKWDLFGSQLMVNAALFRTEKTNARTEDPVNTTDIVVLEGKQRVQGFEIGAAGNITPDLNLSAGYTYMDSKVVSSKNATEVGRPLSNTPKHSLSAWSTYTLPFKLQLGAGAQYVGERFNSTTTSATSSPRLAQEYWLADAMLAYPVNKNLTLRLNAYNLADKRYIDRVGGGHFVPGAGRSAIVTSEWTF